MCAAPPAFGARVAASFARATCSTRPLSLRPAACSSAEGRAAAMSAATSPASALSHAMISVGVAAITARMEDSRPCPACATRPLRDERTIREAPPSDINLAPRIPSPPSPPLISHDPQRSAFLDAVTTQSRQRRAACRELRPQAISCSAHAAASARSALTSELSGVPGATSKLTTRIPGCSMRSTRAKPHTPP